MKPLRHNLRIRRGIDFGPLTIQAVDTEDDPIDLTGWEVFAQTRTTPASELAFSLAPVISNGPAGEIKIEFNADETLDLPTGNYGWDLVLKTPEGRKQGPYVAGTLTVEDLHTHHALPEE